MSRQSYQKSGESVPGLPESITTIDAKDYVRPETFSESFITVELGNELKLAASEDPVLTSWLSQDSDDSSDPMEDSDTSSLDAEEQTPCGGLLDENVDASVEKAIQRALAEYGFHFEEELRKKRLDIYGRIASVNVLRKLVYEDKLRPEIATTKWRNFIADLYHQKVALDVSLLQSFIDDDALLGFVINNLAEEEWREETDVSFEETTEPNFP